MDRTEAVRRWLMMERPTRAVLVEQAGVSPMCGHKLAHGTTMPLPATLEKFERVAAQRRTDVLAELAVLDVILTR